MPSGLPLPLGRIGAVNDRWQPANRRPADQLVTRQIARTLTLGPAIFGKA